MATLSYTFRPSLLAGERTIVVSDTGIAVRRAAGEDQQVPWTAIDELHIEPVTGGSDGKARFVARIRARGHPLIQIDSVNVRGTDDFEHKVDEFLAVLRAIHAALATRASEVRFRFGPRRGVLIAWRIALLMLTATGIFGMVAAVIAEEYEALFGALAFVGFGVSGLRLLRGGKGPVAYDIDQFLDERKDGSGAT